MESVTSNASSIDEKYSLIRLSKEALIPSPMLLQVSHLKYALHFGH